MAPQLATHATPPGWLQGLLGVAWMIGVCLVSLAVYVGIYVTRVRRGQSMGTTDDHQFSVEFGVPVVTVFVLIVSASTSMFWPDWTSYILIASTLPLIWFERWLARSLSRRVLVRYPPPNLPSPPTPSA